MQDSTVYVNGVNSNSVDNSISSCIEKVLLKATNNLEWLSSGDIVLLKPALNSEIHIPLQHIPFQFMLFQKS